MLLTAEEVAYLIYSLEITQENGALVLSSLRDAGLEPLTLVNSGPFVAIVVASTKLAMKPWRFKCLETNHVHFPIVTEHIKTESNTTINTTTTSNSVLTAPSRETIIDFAKQIFTMDAVSTVTKQRFLTENVKYLVLIE
ncbi:hypothetical protein G6F43_007989 [Rhizopus delemar]|nr:hypothetical protein G6F43_007989 [Rhizopus delemar]